MSDDDKKNPDDFEDEFDFDEEAFDESDLELDLDTVEASSKPSELKSEKATVTKRTAPKTPIPLIVTVLVALFLGWKGYGWLKSPSEEPGKQKSTPVTAQIIPAEPETAKSEEIFMEPSDLLVGPNKEKVEEVITIVDEPTPEMDVSTNQKTPVANAQQATHESAVDAKQASTDSDVSGAAWLTTEQDMYGINSSSVEVAKSEMTVAKLVKKLESQDEAAHKRIKVIEDNLAELIQTVATTGKNVSQIGLVVDDLSKTIDTLTQGVVALKEQTVRQEPVQSYRQPVDAKNPSSGNIHPSVTNDSKPRLNIQALGSPKAPEELERSGAYAFASPQVTVHAVIPGRAWLKGKEGRIQTITEGDYVEGYGKVIAIDASRGVVITSSGLTLK